MTLHPGLEPACLNPWSLQNALWYYEREHGPLEAKKRAEYVLPSNISIFRIYIKYICSSMAHVPLKTLTKLIRYLYDCGAAKPRYH